MEVFLSYPSERLATARDVHDFLHSMGVQVWFDRVTLVPGQNWDRERAEAQKRADLTVLICSAETVTRQGVIQREIKDILLHIRDKPIGQIYLVSIRTEDVRLPPELAQYHYLDHFKSDWQLQLGRSIDLKFRELQVAPPQSLDDFLIANRSPDTRKEARFAPSSSNVELVAQFFSYNAANEYWTFVNATILSRVMTWFYATKSFVLHYRANQHSWSLRAEEFFRKDDFLSIRLFVAGYSSILAYDTNQVICINFGGSRLGQFRLRELFVNEGDALQFLVKYCKLDLERQNLSLHENSSSIISQARTSKPGQLYQTSTSTRRVLPSTSQRWRCWNLTTGLRRFRYLGDKSKQDCIQDCWKV